MSQFVQYSSGDASAPSLTGQVGTLITVLDAVLVNGYGSGAQAAGAGWTKPDATVSNSCSYKQGSAAKAGFRFVLHDNGLVNTFEAKATGWKTTTNPTTPVGAGNGQFPMPAQLLTNGCVNIRKATANNGTTRTWTIFADARTFYMFINSEGTTLRTDFGFGEFYSLWGASDINNCFISGRITDSSASVSNLTGGLDKMLVPSVTSNNTGAYFADSYAGISGSQLLYPCGDSGKTSTLMTSSGGTVAVGNLPTPNTSDGAYYLAPMQLLDSNWGLRGRYRGLYHICHPLVNITDGATITGTGDLSGKTFTVINPAGAGAMIAVETSATLDTN
jgi:hypothetical protein